jgi:hypothetical protein
MGTLVCRIELNKQSGITVTVENADGQITQTIHLDGNAITTTCKGTMDSTVITQRPNTIITECKGAIATSTITQVADAITIKCNNFTVDAQEILCKSLFNTKHQSMQKFEANSLLDMQLQSATQLKLIAGVQAQMQAGVTADVTGGALASVQAPIVKIG